MGKVQRKVHCSLLISAILPTWGFLKNLRSQKPPTHTEEQQGLGQDEEPFSFLHFDPASDRVYGLEGMTKKREKSKGEKGRGRGQGKEGKGEEEKGKGSKARERKEKLTLEFPPHKDKLHFLLLLPFKEIVQNFF